MKQNSIFLSRDLVLQLQKEGIIKPNFRCVAHWIDEGIGGINLVYKKEAKVIPEEIQERCTPAPTFEELLPLFPYNIFAGKENSSSLSFEYYNIQYKHRFCAGVAEIDGDFLVESFGGKQSLVEAAAILLLKLNKYGFLCDCKPCRLKNGTMFYDLHQNDTKI